MHHGDLPDAMHSDGLLGQGLHLAQRHLRVSLGHQEKSAPPPVWLRTMPSKTTTAPSSPCLMSLTKDAESMGSLTKATDGPEPPLTGGSRATSSPSRNKQLLVA